MLQNGHKSIWITEGLGFTSEILIGSNIFFKMDPLKTRKVIHIVNDFSIITFRENDYPPTRPASSSIPVLRLRDFTF